MTHRKDVRALDTLAAAYAAAGRFEQAVATQQVALELAKAAGAEEAANHLRTRLELYRRDRPFQQP